jgi:hypothetical protein
MAVNAMLERLNADAIRTTPVVDRQAKRYDDIGLAFERPEQCVFGQPGRIFLGIDKWLKARSSGLRTRDLGSLGTGQTRTCSFTRLASKVCVSMSFAKDSAFRTPKHADKKGLVPKTSHRSEVGISLSIQEA